MVLSPGDGYRNTANADNTPHVHFSGDWTDDERTTVQEVIDRVETSQHAGPQASRISKPWLCVSTYVEEQDARFFFASRIKLNRVFRGRSARELADAITRRFPL